MFHVFILQAGQSSDMAQPISWDLKLWSMSSNMQMLHLLMCDITCNLLREPSYISFAGAHVEHVSYVPVLAPLADRFVPHLQVNITLSAALL